METGTAIGLWQSLAAAGGLAALVFIVVLVIALAVMTTVFLGSAVIVLERFARVSRSPVAVVGFGVLFAGGIAAVLVSEQRPELAVAPWSEWLAAYRVTLVRALGACIFAISVAALALRFVSARWLARIAVGWVATAAGLYLAAPPVLELVFGMPSDSVSTVGGVLGGLFITIVVFGLLPLAAAGLVSMRKSAEWFIAVRYLVARRRQVFISAITAICITGIAAGVWLIITVLSVMNGFERTWREEIIGNRAHFTVHSGFGPFEDYESVLKVVGESPEVTAVSPYLDAEGMVRGKHGDVFAVRLRGVDPTRVARVTDLGEDMQVGSLEDLIPRHAENGHGAPPPGIAIGSQLAAAVGVGVGDRLLLISPYGGPPTPLGPAPRLKRFEVVGVFQSSFFQYDEVYTYTSLAAAQDFRKAGDVVDGLEARTTDLYRSRRVASEVIRTLDYPFYTRDWKEYFPAFFQALKTERVMMFLLLIDDRHGRGLPDRGDADHDDHGEVQRHRDPQGDGGRAMRAIERIFALQGNTDRPRAGTLLGSRRWDHGGHESALRGCRDHASSRITGIDTLPAERLPVFDLALPRSTSGQIVVVDRARLRLMHVVRVRRFCRATAGRARSIRPKGCVMSEAVAAPTAQPLVRDQGSQQGPSRRVMIDDRRALKGINLSLDDRAGTERLAVVGQSGVGKSTFLHILGNARSSVERARRRVPRLRRLLAQLRGTRPIAQRVPGLRVSVPPPVARVQLSVENVMMPGLIQAGPSTR